MVLAVAHPWASASSYLSSQSVADSRCNPHATPRSSYSRRSPSCRFFLCRAALLCLVPQRHRRLSVPCSRGFSCLSAQFRSPRGVFWPLEFIKLSSRENDSSDAHSYHLPTRHVTDTPEERKKTDKPNEGWEEDRVPTCTSRILEGRSGTQGNGSGERIATRRGAGQGSPTRQGPRDSSLV